MVPSLFHTSVVNQMNFKLLLAVFENQTVELFIFYFLQVLS